MADLFSPQPARTPPQRPALPPYLDALHNLADAAREQANALPPSVAAALLRLDSIPCNWRYEALPIDPTQLMAIAGDEQRTNGGTAIDIWRAMARTERTEQARRADRAGQ